MSDSSTGGYIAPSGAGPDDDLALDVILQRMVAGITGLPGGMVRPRWQERPPTEPEVSADWCAIGVLDHTREVGAFLATDDVSTRFRRNEDLSLLASFYGPNAGANAGRLADGLALQQNLEAVAADGLVLGEVGTVRAVPDLLHALWRRRYDVPVLMRRRITRTYPIRPVAGLGVLSLHTEI